MRIDNAGQNRKVFLTGVLREQTRKPSRRGDENMGHRHHPDAVRPYDAVTPRNRRLRITCRQFRAQISTQLSPFLSGVGMLDVDAFLLQEGVRDDLDLER
jgi:hypothetical protein